MINLLHLWREFRQRPFIDPILLIVTGITLYTCWPQLFPGCRYTLTACAIIILVTDPAVSVIWRYIKPHVQRWVSSFLTSNILPLLLSFCWRLLCDILVGAVDALYITAIILPRIIISAASIMAVLLSRLVAIALMAVLLVPVNLCFEIIQHMVRVANKSINLYYNSGPLAVLWYLTKSVILFAETPTGSRLLLWLCISTLHCVFLTIWLSVTLPTLCYYIAAVAWISIQALTAAFPEQAVLVDLTNSYFPSLRDNFPSLGDIFLST